MTTDLASVRPDATVMDAARTMEKANIGTVVVTDGGTLQGLVTDRDLVVRRSALAEVSAAPPTR